MNDWLFGQLGSVDDYEQLLDLAQTRNQEEFESHLILPLDDDELATIVKNVWKDRENFKDWSRDSQARSLRLRIHAPDDDLRRDGGDGFSPIQLRKNHAARCARR